ncbi:MAG: GntG family PLP-dependent aldolase, partial [Deltaproteobacteria bacterium]
AMREAMARAEVGDDVFGEDPTVRALEDRVASLLGKEASLFVPSGTMANQLALMLLTHRGDEVIVGEGNHCAFYESGAGAVLAGVQFIVAGQGGLFAADDVDARAKPVADWYPRTSVVALENTHNRAGGRIFPQDAVLAVTARARDRGYALHLDGARLWNAHAATGIAMNRLAAPFDTVSVCLSKGLGAPVGSMLCTTRERIVAARRLRKMLGGGMRQVGILAAAGMHALDHHVTRLVEDHANARRLHAALNEACGGGLAAPDTNIVMLDLPGGGSADAFCARARESGVLASAFGPTRVRLVTHLDANREAVDRAATILAGMLGG